MKLVSWETAGLSIEMMEVGVKGSYPHGTTSANVVQRVRRVGWRDYERKVSFSTILRESGDEQG